ncbi:MAG: selenocysteine-specific translation elongation factor [Actinomycetota bacterium]|nr:selenocysteine-specific translation elongation factor [Actinomycetota bacterium]
MHVVATAGHVDHGKSTLVRALTGTDPDRLAEEKARGLTIELGFARLVLPSGHELGFVDVPGHVRFIRNMLAGVGAVDACLFVVAATEGWKPQSEEHLRILELLGIGRGVVALTKIDAADDELRELAAADVAEHLDGTFLADAPIIGVDGLGGAGLDELVEALDELTRSAPRAADRGRPRLWVDRAFAAQGAGTVVTGTLTGGTLEVGDQLVVGSTPTTVRVRGLQSHGEDRAGVQPGRRVAINLVGIAHDDVARGDAIVRDGQWHPCTTADVELRVLDGLTHEVSRRGAYLAYLGSAEVPVRLRLLGPRALAPGERGVARLHLDRAVPLVRGDRYVLRESGRGETVGGGVVYDVDPVVAASRAAPDLSTDRVVTERGWIEATVLERLTGERRAPDLGPWVVAPDARRAVEDRVRDAVAGAGTLGLDTAALDERERLVLDTLDDVEVVDGRARPAAVADPLEGHWFVEALERDPFRPPDPDGVAGEELRGLVRRGDVVKADGGLYFAASAVDRAGRELAVLLGRSPEGVTMSAVREHLGTTRKYALPLMALLDARGMTRRRGDVRIAGPRLPTDGGPGG